MTTNQTQESPLRLENLGHVSGHYGSLPTMREWCPDKKHSSPVNSFPTKKPYVIQSINPKTSQLLPAKNQNCYSDVSKPGPDSQRPRSEYREASTRSLHPEVLIPGPKRTIPSYAHTSRPTTVYSAYRPTQSNPSERSQDRIIRNSISLCESPGTYYEDHNNAHSDYSNAKSSHTPSSPAYLPKQDEHLAREYSFLETDTARAAQAQQCCPRSQDVVRVDGVDFNLVSNKPAPNGSPPSSPSSISPSVSSPVLSPSSNCGNRSSMVSICSTRSGNPYYGAWSPSPVHPGPLRPRKASLIDRTWAHFERGLSRAGWKSLPSSPRFKVHSVTKSRSNLFEADSGKKSFTPAITPPPSNEASWTERTQKINQELPCAENEENIARKQSIHPWRAGLPTCTLPPRPPKKRFGLRCHTSFTPIPIPQGIAELEAPLGNAPSPKRYSDDSYDSLFLKHRKSAVRHQASAPMFSSEYARRRAVTVNTENRGGKAQWRPPSAPAQAPRAQSAVSIHHWSQDERVDPRAIPAPLSLRKPCLSDDRRDWPSRDQQHDAASRRILTRKKGILLR
ncbi:hypothetical protein EV127DRAFT_482708 [Xylaria flabelliformis]|nr:hypothetical protein EV127DRAFT_482708 [Xylaria flabelliformis]